MSRKLLLWPASPRQIESVLAYKKRGVKKMAFREGGFRGRSFGPREEHDATCSDCGQACKVPFKPTDGRPVYCRDCFQKHKPERRF